MDNPSPPRAPLKWKRDTYCHQGRSGDVIVGSAWGKNPAGEYVGEFWINEMKVPVRGKTLAEVKGQVEVLFAQWLESAKLTQA